MHLTGFHYLIFTYHGYIILCSTTHYTDGAWSATAGRVLLFGGVAAFGPLCGLGSAAAGNVFGFADATLGARLGFYGTATIVSGTKLLTL